MLLGSELTRPDHAVQLAPDGLLHHTLIVGQSGSGKSFCVARLVEELILRTRARVLIMDPNGDFRSLSQPAAANPRLAARRQEMHELSASTGITTLELGEDFAAEWAGRRFLSLVPGHAPSPSADHGRNNRLIRRLLLHWDRLDPEDHDFLLNVESTSLPQLAAGIAACQSNAAWVAAERPDLSTGNDLRGLARIADKFGEREISLSRHQAVKTLTSDDWLAVAARFKDLLRQYTIWWSQSPGSKRPFGLHDYIGGAFDADPESELYWNVLTLSLDSAARPDSLLTSYLSLGELWKLAKTAWRRHVASPDDRLDARVPTFIVIDEAHNFAPETPRSALEARITDRLIQFASEGRKYGLYLILATQRPTKLHKSLVAECENSCVLRIQSHLELEFASSVLGIPDQETHSVPRFEQGHALVSGRWVDRDLPVTTFVGPARTVVGGGGLPNTWLELPEPSPPFRADRIDREVRSFLEASDRAVPIAVLASHLLDQFVELEAGVWDGQGSFLEFLRSRDVEGLRIDSTPPGYVWIDGKHPEPQAAEAPVRDWGTGQDAARVLDALVEITHLPRLDTDSFRRIYEVVSAEVEASGFSFAEVTKKVREVTASDERPISRLAANSVVRGITYSGHDWSTDLAQDAATLAASYVRSQEYAIRKHDIEVTPAARSEIVRLIGGELVASDEEALIVGELEMTPDAIDQELGEESDFI